MPDLQDPSGAAEREKSAAALSSVVAAVVLTGMKVVVGLLTGSLGILAEAAHSGLDLVAALATLVAVKVSSRPADPTHTYGHGKVENLSALFQTGLLLVTCVWIIDEAVRRLFVRSVHVEAGLWAFLVMAVSIAVDISRARVLRRAARKHQSQALEADALHFSTDVWSSLVVIAGLGFVRAADAFGVPWLQKADAVAALGVSAIVIYVSLALGRRTIRDLLDGVPAHLREDVARAARVSGVLEVRNARVRRAGPEFFVDAVLIVGRHEALEHAHDISNRAGDAIRRALGRRTADVVIHVEPGREEAEDLVGEVRMLAARHGLAAHDIRSSERKSGAGLELHIEIDGARDVAEAHARASAFEEDLRRAIPGLDRIVTHLEPVKSGPAPVAEAEADREAIRRIVSEVAAAEGVVCDPHEIEIEDEAGELAVSLHCALDPAMELDAAHRLTERFELALRAGVDRVGRVLIHVEPPE
ncbi:MAG: cation diffusion facilitator family transporter [Candidatus Aminicenantes bacterium]|nr:cation diffusion facilitator family transporter [Candidatus Aminicenantes bacterium]